MTIRIARDHWSLYPLWELTIIAKFDDGAFVNYPMFTLNHVAEGMTGPLWDIDNPQVGVKSWWLSLEVLW